MLTVAIPKRNKLQNIIVLTPKDGSQSELAQITEIQGFCTNAEMEIAWALGG